MLDRDSLDEHTLSRQHLRYLLIALLIVDELGFVPFERAKGERLFNLLADRYEHHSTIVNTNVAFSEWVQVFGDEKLTTALLEADVSETALLHSESVVLILWASIFICGGW